MNRGLDLIGRQIGVYRVEELIGAGGYSRVYRGMDKTVGRMAAIKMLLPAAGEDGYSDRVIQRFEREARIVANLRDPHSVLLYEYGQTDDGLLYMIFEYIEGHTLEELRRQQFALPALRVVKILEQILLSLEEAHAMGLIHRDIKPANIMVFEHIGRTDQVKVLDFGVGKAMGGHDDGQDLTQTGMLIGTPRYMAPEQWSTDGDISPQTDIYSLGLVIYELLTGARAITAADPVHIMKAHLDSNPIELPTELDIPSGLRQVVNTMLKKNRAERYRCVTQVLADLMRLKPLGADSNTMLLDEVKLRGTEEEAKIQGRANDRGATHEAEQIAGAGAHDAPKTAPPGDTPQKNAEGRPADAHAHAPQAATSPAQRPKPFREEEPTGGRVKKRRCAKTIRLEPGTQITHTAERPRPIKPTPPAPAERAPVKATPPPIRWDRMRYALLASFAALSILIGGFALYQGLSNRGTSEADDTPKINARESAPSEAPALPATAPEPSSEPPPERDAKAPRAPTQPNTNAKPQPLNPKTVAAHPFAPDSLSLTATNPSHSNKNVAPNPQAKPEKSRNPPAPDPPSEPSKTPAAKESSPKKPRKKDRRRRRKPAKEPKLEIWGID